MSKGKTISLSCFGCLGICVLGFIVLGVAGIFVVKAETDYFSEHRDEIIATTKADLESEDYDAVIKTAEKYALVSDPELERLRRDAEQARKDNRIAALRVDVSKATDPAEKREILAELVELAPDDARARDMLAEIDQQTETVDAEIPSHEHYIPGLKAVDVYGNFTDKGFSLEKDYMPAFTDSGIEFPAQYQWTCTAENSRHKMMVNVSGASPSELTMVRATYYNYSRGDTDEGGTQFLTYAASIPYEGSMPSDAQAWIRENVGKQATTTIGDVSLELIANAPRVRVLLIQPVARDRDETK